MFSWFSAGKRELVPDTPSNSNGTGPSPAAVPSTKGFICILVLQQDAYDWSAIFEATLATYPNAANMPDLQIVQTSWADIEVGAVDNDKTFEGPLFENLPQRFVRAPVAVRKLWKDGKPQPLARPLTVFPNLVLVRNEFHTPSTDYRNQLLGLVYADCPAINALQSVLLSADKPVMYGALHRLRNVRFADRTWDFPILEQTYAASHDSFFYGRSFPAVVKFGSAHAGMGKLRVTDHHAMEDVRTLLPMSNERFATAEPFVEAVGDLRLQKIGSHLRAFFRESICGAWKTNTQTSVLQEIEVTPLMAEWLEAASSMFGRDPRNRLAILSIDVLVKAKTEVAWREARALAPDGQGFVPPPEVFDPTAYRIIEVNGTSTGLSPTTAEVDNQHIAALVLERVEEMLETPTVAHEPTTTTTAAAAAEEAATTSSADAVMPRG